jgi:D-aminopeptidase
MTPYARLDAVLDSLPSANSGIGGAAAVLKDGELLAQRTWGWADQDRRIPFTPQSLFRICSISKQFTVATVLGRYPDTSELDSDIAHFMPYLNDPRLKTLHLAHNQSGLRDYWATAMLSGSPVEAPFGPTEAAQLIARTRGLHFAPGTRNSYCNHNFRLLGDLVSRRTGTDLATLMRRHVFDPAGMPRALLCPETATLPDGTIGYEGSLEGGWRPAVNHIHWTGDAGIAASLEDMIAWEKHIDAQRDDPDALITRMSAPVTFADGAPAFYGYGLARMTLHGRAAIGHGGGLRGWLSQRCYLPAERISIVALHNHMNGPRPTAMALLAALLDDVPTPPDAAADPSWAGFYLDPETGLSAKLEVTGKGKINLFYAGLHPDTLDPQPDGSASADRVRLVRDGGSLVMHRAGENLRTTLVRLEGEGPPPRVGEYRNAEYESRLTVVNAGGLYCAAFSGPLGIGTMQPLLPAGPDMWRMPCPRALDHSPPGDWTLHFHDGGVRVGCWLARGIEFAG